MPAAGYSIVVATWRSSADLARLVDSLNAHLAGTPELVVVENASGDDPEPAARRWRGEVSVLRQRENVGFGRASNAGVEAASGAAVVLLNPDTQAIDSSLDALAGAALAERVLAGPRVLNSDRSRQPSASGPVVGALPWVRALVPGALHPPALQALTEPGRVNRAVRVSWLTGACIAAPRELLLELGPFDPAIELFAEDMDLGLRAAAAGAESWFRPDLATIVHHGAASTVQRFAPGEEMRMSARYRVAAMRRAYGARRESRAARAERVHLGLRAAAKRVLGRRDAARRDAALLAAARAARDAPALPAPPAGRTRAPS